MTDGEGQSDLEALRIARLESRSVLDHRINLLNDLDDKAIRTVRLSIVILALIISVAQIGEGSALQSAHLLTQTSIVFSGGLLVLAIFIGLGVYSHSNPILGVAAEHREEVISVGYTEREWLEYLLGEYDEWNESLVEAINTDAKWTFRAQSAMAIALAYLFMASLAYIVPVSAPAVFIILILLMAIALLAHIILRRYRNHARGKERKGD